MRTKERWHNVPHMLAALVIRSISIRGFDYSRAQKKLQKRGKTTVFKLN
jgi:hypothetical protein